MKYFYLIISTCFLCACGGSEEEGTSASNETGEALEEQINCESGKAFIESYKSIREATVEEDDGELYTMKGEIFYDDEGILVVSMMEEWGQYVYWVTIVLNEDEQVDELEEEDGMYSDIQIFLKSYLAENYSVYVGRMIESPDYDIAPYSPGLLEVDYSYRDETDTYQHLCLIDGAKFIKTEIFAHTHGNRVECEMIHGKRERFQTGNYDYQIVIDTEEHSLDMENDCEINYAFGYQRTYDDIEATLKNGKDPWFLCEYYLEDYFKDLPTNDFYYLYINSNDTLIGFDKFSFIKEQNENNFTSARMRFLGLQDIHEVQVVGMDQREDMGLIFYTRNVYGNFEDEIQVYTFNLHKDQPTNIYMIQVGETESFYVDDENAYEHEKEDDYYD